MGRGGCKLAPESQGDSAPESSSLPRLESFKMLCNVSFYFRFMLEEGRVLVAGEVVVIYLFSSFAK